MRSSGVQILVFLMVAVRAHCLNAEVEGDKLGEVLAGYPPILSP